MGRYQIFSVIAAVLVAIGISPGANAQYVRYDRHNNNTGDRIGTPGFSQPVFMPNRSNTYYRNRYGGSDYGDGRYRRGNEQLTIINGGSNCINCSVDGWGRSGSRNRGNWQNPYPRNIRFVY
jgi:hypothetical protein